MRWASGILLLTPLMGGYALPDAPGRQKRRQKRKAFRLSVAQACRQSDDKGRPAWSLISPEAPAMTSEPENCPGQTPGVNLCQRQAAINIPATQRAR